MATSKGRLCRLRHKRLALISKCDDEVLFYLEVFSIQFSVVYWKL